MSIYCAHMPLHMTVMKTTLCVAFQDPNTATYSIVHYNLVNKSEFHSFMVYFWVEMWIKFNSLEKNFL